MSRYRLQLSRTEEVALLRHCADARYVWNLCVEQESWWRPGRGPMPRFAERCRQLTAARENNQWLAEGSVIVQQQAIRDHAQAMTNFFAGTHRRPTWRKAGRDEGFRIVQLQPSDVRRLSRQVGAVRVPKTGWVRFRWSRPVPVAAKSCRITRDRAGRWHVAFAVAPEPAVGPGDGSVVGVDRGVAVSAAQEPSRLRLHRLRIRLPRRRERGTQHRGGARRDCAGRPGVGSAREPRTSAARLIDGT
jgi:putative transposase